MTDLHKEINFENEICDHLSANGWLYQEGDANQYDREYNLFSSDFIEWVQSTQPVEWDTLQKNNGLKTREIIIKRLRNEINQRGTIDVLRQGIDCMGLKKKLITAQFKPALGINTEVQGKYLANRLRVVRQLRYSLFNENSIDLVLFLNGIPVATIELKSDFTQSVTDAIDQYRYDRNPKPHGQLSAEPLLSFPNGAVVHFAVSNSEVSMTTYLAGAKTIFLPFNRGNQGASGNPVNENGGHRTAYLWEQIWQRDSWLEIIGRYLVTQKDNKKQIKKIIFPRYHQLDATRKLVDAILQEGSGEKYLIQHSAGSGKTNSIAWTAHLLADLHNNDNQKIFDSVLVVSDRTVLDSQLQEAIFDFQRTTGVVASITNNSGSKSNQLALALSQDKKIVVCTIQTFPFALKEVQELSATQNKRFAVIADEAHSSQTGAAAAKLKTLLSDKELEELNDGGEFSTEDLLAIQMGNRSAETGITYIAFTATPKSKTLELFGRKPNPDEPSSTDNLPQPFHVYSMRQAIEEGFILDVLKNYTSYSLAFKLAHNGKELTEVEVDKSEALKGIMRWVKLHPYNISQKVEIVVEHFRKNVSPLLHGEAKAMIVVSSRLEAVRWKISIDKYIKNKQNSNQLDYQIGTIVAFSGEINDTESGAEPFTEVSKNLNPNLKGQDIRDAFDKPDYQILLVANKFQTGFDQPKLCGMYVDKKLSGIAAVQTLSRLNRAYPNKDTTYILDFINDPKDILEAFQTYYETAELSGVTDPEVVYNLRNKLDSQGFYDESHINAVVSVELNANAKQSELIKALEPVVSRIQSKYKTAKDKINIAKAKGDVATEKEAKEAIDALILFKKDIGAFQRMYSFLSQIYNYGNTEIESRYIFFKRLLPQLDFSRERGGIDLSKVVLTHHKLKNHGTQAIALGDGDKPTLDPLGASGTGQVYDKEKVMFDAIIKKVNDLFEGELSDDDKLVYVNTVLKGKLLESEILVQQATNSTKEQFADSPDLKKEMMNAIMDALAAHTIMSNQALASEKIRDGLQDILLGQAHLYEALKSRGTQNLNL
jgi:type I restriction enzyme R subunit